MNSMLVSLLLVQPTPEDPQGAIAVILRALGDRSWIAFAGGATILLVWVLRTFGSKWIPWLATPRGGVILVAACGVLAAIGSALVDGKFTFKEIVDGIATALVAGGGWSLTKNAVKSPVPAPPGV